MSIVAEASQPENSLNFDDFSLEETREFLDSGKTPEPKEPIADPAPEAVVEEPVKAEEEVANKTAEGVVEEEAKAEVADPAAEEEGFKFTENADLEVFSQEKTAYLDTVELTPELQHILDEQERRYNDLNTEFTTLQTEKVEATDPVGQEIVTAFDQMVTKFRANADGKFVPDTTELVRALEKNYPQETPQLIRDLVTMPSPKYVGQTTFQEFIRDGFGLDDTGMRNLEEFLDNGGRIPGPTIVPEGINPQFAEAFWMSQDRSTLESAIEEHKALMEDEFASPEDRQRAQASLKMTVDGINTRLELMQQGLDAQKFQKDQRAQQERQRQTSINEEAGQNFIDTTNQLLRAFSSKLSESFTMFEGPGAGVTALAYTTLVQQALADNEWSKYAQEDLAKYGITFDWKKGQETLTSLYETEQLIAQQKLSKANPRALEISQRAKASKLKELKALETDLMGRIAKVAITGVNKAIETKVATAPKIAAVRPKERSQTGQPASTDGSLTEMPLEELRARLGEERARRIAQGLPTY